MKKNSLSIRALLPLVACLGLTFIPSAMAQHIWTGDIDNDWNTADNWSDDTVPNGGAGETVTIASDGANVTMSAAGSSRNLVVSGNGGTAPVLNITENLSNNFSSVSVGSDASGNGYGGTINHTSGTFSVGGGSGVRRLLIASAAGGGSTGNSGSFFFGGDSGSAPVASIANQVFIGTRPGETGLLSLSNHGDFTADGMLMSQFNGDSTFEVKGGDLSISFTSSVTMSAAGSGTSTISATLTSSGFSTILITGGFQLDNGMGGNNTVFDLDLDGYSGAVNDVIEIIDATTAFTGFGEFGNVTDGDILAVDGYEFEADYDTTDHIFSLRVVTVPEPTSTSLIGGGAMLMMAWRRRQRRNS